MISGIIITCMLVMPLTFVVSRITRGWSTLERYVLAVIAAVFLGYVVFTLCQSWGLP